MDFLTKILAQLFDTFKANNPKVAAIIILVLMTIIGFADQGSMLGLFSLPGWAAETLKWVSTVILAIVGSRTAKYLTLNEANASR